MKRPPINAEFTKITVSVEERDDGGLRVYSPDVPGLVLSHSDKEAVWDDVKPALEFILSQMWGVPVIASPLKPLRNFEEDNDAGQVPDAHVCLKEYVAYAT